MKKLIISLLLLCPVMLVLGQGLETKYHKTVYDFINIVKGGKAEQLAAVVNYPFRRRYPLADVKNKEEFTKAYNEIFDQKLIKMITGSKPSINWFSGGWRGLALGHGDLWIGYGGNLLAVNYESPSVKKHRQQLIAAEKTILFPALRTFKQPMLILESSSYRIRIDDMGNSNYRYTSWPLKSKMIDKPALVIEKGEWTPDGSGGNHIYTFKTGAYRYECAIIVDGEQLDSPCYLTIYKNDRKVLFQKARNVRK